MTTNFPRKQSFLWVFLIPILIIGVLIFLSLGSELIVTPATFWYSALILDFTLTIPLVYFFLIRKKKISKFTIVPVFILGLVLSTLLIPSEEKGVLTFILNWVFPIVEIIVFAKISHTVFKLVKTLKQTRNQNTDFYEAFLEASAQIFPTKMKHIIASEASLIYYCFFAWRNPKLKSNEFSYHHKTPVVSLLYGFMLLIIAEGIGLHLWLDAYNSILAWVFSALSAYGILQVFGILKSIPKRPIVVNENEVLLKFGLLGSANLAKSNIESIYLNTKDIPEDIVDLKKLFLVDHNILITLKNNQRVPGLYGLKKDAKHIALFVDQPTDFIKMVQTNSNDEI